MKPKHYVSVIFMAALIFGGLIVAVRDLTGPVAGIDYCAAVKETTCKVAGTGEFAVVTAGPNNYVVYVDKGKVIYVEKK